MVLLAAAPQDFLQVFEVCNVEQGSNPLRTNRSQQPARSLPVAVGSCAVIGAAMGVFDYGGQLAGDRRERDSPETFEERRKKFFKQKPSLSESVTTEA